MGFFVFIDPEYIKKVFKRIIASRKSSTFGLVTDASRHIKTAFEW